MPLHLNNSRNDDCLHLLLCSSQGPSNWFCHCRPQWPTSGELVQQPLVVHNDT